MEYTDFVIKIDPIAGMKYLVSSQSIAGEYRCEFVFPFDEKDLEIFFLKVGGPRRGTRRIDSPEMKSVRDFGHTLFKAVFSEGIHDAFVTCRYDSLCTDRGFRIKLRISDAPAINELPWEYLFDGNHFIALSNFSPIIRHLDLPSPIRPLAIDPPINVLCMVSTPFGVDPLDMQAEFEKISHALKPLIGADILRLKLLPQATLAELQKELRRSTYHILHYVGHGRFDNLSGDGILLFENEKKQPVEVDGLHLSTILNDHHSLRLAVLNSCEGARSSKRDPFSSFASVLVKGGIPAVVAMQFEITDNAAINFAEDFYSSITDGLSVESAVTEARKSIFASGNDIEWGTPVLFLRGNSGDLFDTYKSGRRIIEATRAGQIVVSANGELSNSDIENYQVPATSVSPALYLYLIDVSGSMSKKVGEKSRIQLVSDTISATIIQMVYRSSKGKRVSPRYRIAIIAYSDDVFDVLGGIKTIDQVAAQGIPEFNTLEGTNTAKAFKAAYKLLQQEIPSIQDGPAPLVCHITDGEFTGDNPFPWADKIRKLSVKDGNVLIENIFISDVISPFHVADSRKWRGIVNKSELQNDYEKILFDMSSTIPSSYRTMMIDAGYDIAPDAKLLIPAVYPELIELGFTMSASTPIARRKE